MTNKKPFELNATRIAILKTLRGSATPLTLGEISARTDLELKSGTINALVKAGFVKTIGDRVIVCAACGHKHKVKEYALDENALKIKEIAETEASTADIIDVEAIEE